MLNLRQLLFQLIRFPVVLVILGIFVLIIGHGCVKEDPAEKLPTSDRGSTLISKVDRKDTVIFDLGGNVIPDPHNLNPLVPSPTGPGMHQCVWEPLFILNYETAEIESWIGESFILISMRLHSHSSILSRHISGRKSSLKPSYSPAPRVSQTGRSMHRDCLRKEVGVDFFTATS